MKRCHCSFIAVMFNIFRNIIQYNLYNKTIEPVCLLWVGFSSSPQLTLGTCFNNSATLSFSFSMAVTVTWAATYSQLLGWYQQLLLGALDTFTRSGGAPTRGKIIFLHVLAKVLVPNVVLACCTILSVDTCTFRFF